MLSKEVQFESKHKLVFEVAKSPYSDDHLMFRVGTCSGQWTSLTDCYVIISVINDEPGNGHFDDVLEWFENSCNRDNKNLLVVECMNKAFYQHLISKRRFVPVDEREENCIKVFNSKAYKRMRKHGNEMLLKGSLKCI